jgi:hypothetical protein
MAIPSAYAAEPKQGGEASTLSDQIRLLELRLRAVEQSTPILEVGTVDLTIRSGETHAIAKVPFQRPPAGAVVILTGETGTAGSWVVTKSQAVTDSGFEVAAIGAEGKPYGRPYRVRVGYVVMKASVLTGPANPESTPQTSANSVPGVTWTEFQSDCGLAAQRINDAKSEALFRQKYLGRKVEWSGRVVSVSEAIVGGGYRVAVKMDPSESLNADLVLNAPAGLRETILSLEKDNVVTFIGQLRAQGGQFSDHQVNLTSLSKQAN